MKSAILEEPTIDGYTREFDGYIIEFPVIDGYNGDLIYLEMEESAFEAWNKALDEEEQNRVACLKEIEEEESNHWIYIRDNE